MDWTTLKQNLATIQHAFMAYGPRILFCAVVLVGIYAVCRLMKAWVVSKKKRVEKAPEIQFLEAALEEDPERKPMPGYTYENFKEDLYNKGLTFEEIYEKCNGVIPQKPPPEAPKPPPPPPVLPMSIHEIEGQNGGQGHSGQHGQCVDRLVQLQQWFQQRGNESPIGRTVKPPPNPYPVIHKIYIRGRR